MGWRSRSSATSSISGVLAKLDATCSHGTTLGARRRSGPAAAEGGQHHVPERLVGAGGDGEVGEVLVADPGVEQVADRQLLAGAAAERADADTVPPTMRTPPASTSAMRFMLMKMLRRSMLATSPSTRSLSPDGRQHDVSDAPDRIAVGVGQGQADEPRDEHRSSRHERDATWAVQTGTQWRI